MSRLVILSRTAASEATPTPSLLAAALSPFKHDDSESLVAPPCHRLRLSLLLLFRSLPASQLTEVVVGRGWVTSRAKV